MIPAEYSQCQLNYLKLKNIMMETSSNSRQRSGWSGQSGGRSGSWSGRESRQGSRSGSRQDGRRRSGIEIDQEVGATNGVLTEYLRVNLPV